MDDNFVFQPYSTLWATQVQLLQCQILHVFFLVTYSPANSTVLIPIDYRIYRLMQQCEYELHDCKVEEIKQWLAEVW